MQRRWDKTENTQNRASPKGLSRIAKEASRFERAVRGIRAKDLAYKNDFPYENGTNSNIRGYGMVASLCSRFMGADQKRFMRIERCDTATGREGEKTDDKTGESQTTQIRHQEVTKQLLKQAIDGRDFALLRIIIRMSPCVKDYLIDKDKDGNTLVHRCCKDGNLRLLTVLIEVGLDVNVKGENKRTPLHIASLHNNIQIVNLLLNSCADVFAKDIEGSRPADLCSDTRVRSTLLCRMNLRSRSFNTKRTRPTTLNKSNIDLNLSRTDSGIVLDNCILKQNHINRKSRTPMSPNRLLSSFRDFRFSKETIV